jgi:diguanylate cyclase (GGDEF)-like protein
MESRRSPQISNPHRLRYQQLPVTARQHLNKGATAVFRGESSRMVSPLSAQAASYPPERFVAEVSSELTEATIRRRSGHINVILRLSMMSGLQMDLEATLNLICDLAAEIAAHEKSVVCFWDQARDQMQLRFMRGFPKGTGAVPEISGSNILNLWLARYGRPLLIPRGHQPQADALLDFVQAQSALAVPLFVSNRVMGSLGLFSPAPSAFTQEDAQLLWILALVAENLLTREYSSEGLVHFAFTDYLTGLRTRGYFEQQLDLEFKRAERRQQKFALLMVDIDGFKELNDSAGHHVGDEVLRQVANILSQDKREIDTVARYGGDEFVIILPETTEQGAVYVAQRLRRAVEQARFAARLPDAPQHLTISVGLAVYDRDGRFKRELIDYSDAALYAAKKEGRNRVVCYSELSRPGDKAS